MNFRIANFNVENLILPDIRFYDRMILTREEYEAKANWSASIINRIEPDIIGIQELWTSEALADVLEPLAREGADRRAASGAATYPG